MKTIRNVLLSLFGILILIIVVLVAAPNGVFPLETTGSDGGYPAPTTPTVPPAELAYPIGTKNIDTTVVEPPESTSPVQTPIPVVEGAFHASETSKLSIDWEVDVERIFDDYVVRGDILLAKVRLMNENTALVEINLNDGSTRMLLEVPQGFTDLHVADRYVIWLNSVEEPGVYERLLQVFDRENGTIITLHKGKIEQLDIRDTFVIWVDSVSKDIVVHNLASQQTQSIVPSSGIARFPRVCSGEWIAFLQNFAQHETFVSTTSAAISLYHLSSGQEMLVGNVSGVPNVPGVRNTSFDCDEQRLVWVSTNSDPQSNDDTELHVYDFASANEAVIENLVGDLEPYDNFVLLDGDIIISRVGYDLVQNVPFTAILDRSKIFGPLYLSNNRLVWVENHENQAGDVYMVSISRGEQ